VRVCMCACLRMRVSACVCVCVLACVCVCAANTQVKKASVGNIYHSTEKNLEINI